MKKGTRKDDEMRAHYNFSGGVRGKYARRYAEGSNVVVLDPDVAQEFPNREAVNETLRAVAHIFHKGGAGTGLTKGWSERIKRVAHHSVRPRNRCGLSKPHLDQPPQPTVL